MEKGDYFQAMVSIGSHLLGFGSTVALSTQKPAQNASATSVCTRRPLHAFSYNIYIFKCIGQPFGPSVRLSVMLSPPKPLDEFQPNLVCEILT